jgi:hypothetical protein
MKKMINSMSRAFVVAVVMVMPLCGMEPAIIKKATSNDELFAQIIEQAHKTIDAALATLVAADKKQPGAVSFEAAKTELIQLMDKLNLAAIDLNKIDLNAKIRLAQLIDKIDFKAKIRLAPLMNKIDIKTKIKLDQLMKKLDDLDAEAKKAMSDAIKNVKMNEMETATKSIAVEVALLDQIVEQANNIINGSFELRPAVIKELDRLMSDENLDIPTKFAISDDIEIIKNAAGMNIIPKVSDAYKHLQCVVAQRKASLGVGSQGTMQQVIDYVSSKFQAIKQAVSNMLYGAGNAQ